MTCVGILVYIVRTVILSRDSSGTASGVNIATSQRWSWSDACPHEDAPTVVLTDTKVYASITGETCGFKMLQVNHDPKICQEHPRAMD